MTFHEYFANFSTWFWGQIANHLWQSTLFALLAVASVALLRTSSAKARYAIWLTASAKFVLPLAAFAVLGTWAGAGNLFPVSPKVESNVSDNISFVNIVSLDAANENSAATVIPSIESAAANTHHEVYCLLALVWAGGCVFLLALWRKRSRAFKRLLAEKAVAPTAAGSRETELLGNARIRAEIYIPVDLVISDFVREPTLLGIWKPAIIVPRGLSEKLTDDEYELILMHELAHAARRDNLIGVLQMALCCLLWFHPLVWFIKRKLLEERERACDETVLARHEGEPGSYISGLLKVVRFGLHTEQPAGLANTTGGANLKKRLELIMNNKIKNTNSKRQRWLVGSAMSSLILLCLIAFFALAQTESAASNGFPAETKSTAQPDAEIYEVEVYANGNIWTTLESNSPKSGGTVFSYSLYHIPDGQTARTASGERIHAFQLIADDKGDAINVEIIALLEDLKTVSDRHPLHEFKKQTIAFYNVRAGETVTISEMSKLGVAPLELKSVKFYRSNPNERRMQNRQDKAEVIKQIEASPNVPYRIIGNEDSPLKITEAEGKEITSSQYTQLTGTTMIRTQGEKEVVFPNVYSVPEIKMINASGKTITGYMIGISEPDSPSSLAIKWRGVGQGKVFDNYPKISIAPGETYIIDRTFFVPPPTVRVKNGSAKSILKPTGSGWEVEKNWLVGFTDKSNFYVSVAQVSFDDGTKWTAKEYK